MSVGMSYHIIIMSVIAFMLGVFVVYISKHNQQHTWLFLMLSIASGFWGISYVCIGMLSDSWLVGIFRVFYIGSIVVMLLTSSQLILIWVKVPYKYRIFISIYSVIASAILYSMVAIKGIVTFVPYKNGFYYDFQSPFWKILYYTLLMNSFLMAVIVMTYGFKKANYHRQRLMGHRVLMCLILLLAGCVWDLLTTSLHIFLLPGSVVTQFISVFFIFLASEYYSISNLSLENVAEYIITVVDMPIMILNEEEAICFVNNRCSNFFHKTDEELLQMHLNDLFADPDASDIDPRAPQYDETIQRKECLLNNKKCELRRNKLYDRYHDMLGDMIIINDITDMLAILKAVKDSKEEAIEANEAKSEFLANMSHEIRTPMNAIVGMSELLLSRGVPEQMENELQSIHSAGTDLLSIINDILDISKIESGKYEIIESEYMLSNVVTNVVNMMAVRLLDKNVHLLVSMDKQLPAVLIGDDIRLKQILVNIVGNAVKFTKKGFIKLHFWSEPLQDGEIMLHASVEDSGIGIQKENMDKLFAKFSQVDTKKNRKLTGTGLGLSIAKELCELMGGSIQVDSIYGKGSTFTIAVKQRVSDASEMIQIQNTESLNILVYEINEHIAENIDYILTSLKIPHHMCSDIKTLNSEKDISHLMLRRKHFAHSKEVFAADFSQEKTILLMDIGEQNMTEWHGYKQIYLPLLNFQIGILLNNLSLGGLGKKSVFSIKNIIPMPSAKVLVVDDNVTNLVVIKGMLEPYEMQVDEALSGYDALVCVEKEKYDVIFMDHMMPDMDGVETTARIRAMEGEYYKTVPIVALTANSFTGARENFIMAGFDEYLHKPILYDKLDHILRKFILPQSSEQLYTKRLASLSQESIRESIDGINMKDSVASLGGNVQVYNSVLNTYLSDMYKRKEDIKELLEKRDFENFIIGIHAMKSASYGVGAMRLGKMAEALERAGKAGDTKWVDGNVEEFITELDHILEGIKEYLEASEREESRYDTATEEKEHRDKLPYEDLQAIRSACEEMDYQALESVLENVNQYEYGEEDEQKLKELTIAFNNFDYDHFMELLKEIL